MTKHTFIFSNYAMLMLKLISLLPNLRGKGKLFNVFKKFYLKTGNPVVNVTGKLGTFYVDLRSFEWEYFCNGTYEQNEINLLFLKINIDEIFIDVGANIGFYSIPVAKHIKENSGKGKVIAFEPHPGNFKRLKENVELNGLNEYIDIHNFALSDEEGSLNLILREDFNEGSETGNASISINDSYDDGFKKIEIETKIFDYFLETLKTSLRIGFIKLDIEGHEDNFLRGAQYAIKIHSPQFILEVNKSYYIAKGVDACSEMQKLLPNYYFGNIASPRQYFNKFLSTSQANKPMSKTLADVALNNINNVYCSLSEKALEK